MNNVTLLTVNWNQRIALEVMLKSYAAFHHTNEPLHLIVADNASTDDSREWMASQGINYIAPEENIGHERAVNKIWPLIKTQYALLVDTDVEFTASIADYLSFIQGNCVCVSEFCNSDWMNNMPMVPRFGPWFILFNHAKIRDAGIVFRNFNEKGRTPGGVLDVGSYFCRECTKAGFTNHHLTAVVDNTGIVHYERFMHYVAVSWDINNPVSGDRVVEILRKREMLKDKVTNYAHVDLRDKFKTSDLGS